MPRELIAPERERAARSATTRASRWRPTRFGYAANSGPPSTVPRWQCTRATDWYKGYGLPRGRYDNELGIFTGDAEGREHFPAVLGNMCISEVIDLEEDDRFAFLLDNPPVLTRMTAILGNCVQLHSATARVTEPGTPDQDWHRDGPWPMDPDGTPIGSIPAQINCGYYLDELTPDNGPIAIVPGSQRAPFRPPKGHPEFPDQLVVLAKPGQAVMFSGWIYHRGVANRSDSTRRVCLMCYQNARG